MNVLIWEGQGPIAIICAPTRELASQIYTEARKYSKAYGMKVAAIYGGLAKIDQIKALKAGVEVVVGTPVFHRNFTCIYVIGTYYRYDQIESPQDVKSYLFSVGRS